MDILTVWIAIGAVGIVCIAIGTLMTGVVGIIGLVQNRKLNKDIVHRLDRIVNKIGEKK